MKSVTVVLMASFSLFVPILDVASAITVVVPDDYSTIQAAIDSDADTVLIKDGNYPERIVLSRGLALINHPSSDGYSADAFPQIGSLTLTQAPYGEERRDLLLTTA